MFAAAPARDSTVPRLLAMGLCLVGLAALPSHGYGATVKGVATDGKGHTDVFVKLSRGQQVRAGQELISSKGWRLKVVEVVGTRARTVLKTGRRPRVGEADRFVPRPAAPTKQQAARTGKAGPNQQPVRHINWSAQRRVRRKLIPSAMSGKQRKGDDSIKGDVSLVAMGVVDLKGLKSWSFAAFQSRLEAKRLWGTGLSWSHDFSVRYDGIGTREGNGQGGARARRLLAVRRARVGYDAGWGGVGAGRLLMSTGASGRMVDGASARLSLGAWGSVTAWGGLAPDPVSLGITPQASRFGLGWQRLTDKGVLKTQMRLGWAAQRVDGRMDPHRVDASVGIQHDRWGELSVAATGVIGQADLSGTALAGTPTDPAQLAYLWVSLVSRRKYGWLGRMRYSFHRPVADRLIARTLPWDVWVDGKSHMLSMSADKSVSRGFWLRPMLHAAWLDSPEAYDGLRVGFAIRAGFRGKSWSPHAAVHVATGLARTADNRAAGPSRNVGGWLGTGYSLSRSWRLRGRVGVRADQILPVADYSLRLRNSTSIEWMDGPWIVALQVGNDTLLTAAPTPGSYKLDWVDVALLIRRRLP
ncbi:MAG: hypothetical protein KC502_13960 [Myxococcales bacterium]|nr:hypothetical protein [Myxococcales bacterium]